MQLQVVSQTHRRHLSLPSTRTVDNVGLGNPIGILGKHNRHTSATKVKS